ncbi:MAG: DMT family transporter [Pseudomonadota bacterium]
MQTHSPEDLRRGYLCAAVVVTIWTGFILVSRMGGKSSLTPYDLIALRYGVAAIAILPFWWHHRTNLLEWRKLALALVGALGFTLFAFNGFRHAPANHAAILLQGFLPFTVSVMAYFILDERPTRRRLAGLGLVALGVSSIALESFGSSGLTVLGDGMLVGASLCWALYTVLLRRWNMPPMDATIAVTLISTVLYLPIYLLLLPKNIAATPLMDCVGFALYQGVIVAVVQMIFYTKSVALLGASRLAMVASIVPVLASLGAVPLLGEPLTLPIAVGLVFTVLGAWVGNSRGATRPIPSAS